MPILELDHLVLGAASLADGASALAARLGVEPDAGGRHEGFGTHNRLLSLGRQTYLELIAPDPGQPAPARPRPFGLDEPAIAERVAARPRLLAYVVRTDDIGAAREALGLPPGGATDMRRGALKWRISLPVAGQPAGTPILIEWGDTPIPSSTLPDRGLRLLGRPRLPRDRAIAHVQDRQGLDGQLRCQRVQRRRLQLAHELVCELVDAVMGRTIPPTWSYGWSAPQVSTRISVYTSWCTTNSFT